MSYTQTKAEVKVEYSPTLKQTALQESESTSYVIGVMTDAIDYDQLPQL